MILTFLHNKSRTRAAAGKFEFRGAKILKKHFKTIAPNRERREAHGNARLV